VGKPPSFLDVSYKVRRGTRLRPPELGIFGGGRRMAYIERFSPFLIRE